METDTLTTRPEEQLSMFYRRFFRPSKGSHLVLFLSCILFWLATCGPCATRSHLTSHVDKMRDPMDYDACVSYGHNYDTGLKESLIGDVRSNYVQGNSPTCSGLKNICTNSEFFCFLSTLPGFLAEDDNCEAALLAVLGSQNDATLPEGSVLNDMWESNSSWSSDHGTFMLLNGRILSCSVNSGKGLHDMSSPQDNNVDRNDLPSCGGPSVKQHRPSSIPDKISEVIKSDLLDGSSSPHVEISPPSLDWGQNYLYFPSLAFLTVANTCNDSILHVYKPFSTDTQFYPCDYDEVLVGPGEVASICFVFLPRLLGFSSAHLVLQTSSGGFLIHAKGLAIESPYGIQPLVGLDVSSNGRWSKNLSLHNPFDDTLYVKEVTAWVSVFSGNTSHSAEAICKIDTFQGSDESSIFLNVKEWLDIKSSQVGSPLMGIKPHRSWEINPHSTESIIEIELFSDTKGKVCGAICMQLQSSLEDRTDTVIIPLEAEVHEKTAYNGLTGSVSVSLESLMPCEGSETKVVTFSLRNGAPSLLSVVKISEVTEATKLFKIKYVEGLLLFPGTVTRIAVVTYTPLPGDSQDPPPEIPNINCKLLIMTNNSGSPQIEIPCQDVVHTCSRLQPASYVGHKLQAEKSKSSNTRTGSLDSIIQSPSHTKFKALEFAEADELVLRNWRSQGTTSGMSVLDDQEVLFPMVQVGTHLSKWITVKNPSHQPVIMQLILNSGAIIDQCRAADEFLQYPLSSSLVRNESTIPTRYGFSIEKTAITQAYVHPYGSAFLGPIVFHPSNRCGWRGSALIRNNLSGVESLPLQGFGGSHSLVLLEGSEPVQSLEFNLDMPIVLNTSPPELLFYMEDTSAACSQSLSKELYAKNMGELPLEVSRVEVSGTGCGSDGFMVHTCKGFTLEPGESSRLLISYRTDHSAAVVYRDLELALTTGILVIPMKASLPVHMLSLCRRSFFWMLLKKLSLVVFVAGPVIFMVFCCILPQVMAFAQDYLFRSEKSSISTISSPGKPSHMHHNERNSKFSTCNNMDRMFSSVREDETSKLGFVVRFPDCPSVVQEQGINVEHAKQVQNDRERIIHKSDFQKETSFLPSSSAERSCTMVETSALPEAPQTGNLTVRIRRERGRRRRRKRTAGAGLTGMLEVSTSQSGNSTPSSPLSPVISVTPKQTWPLSPDVDYGIEARNPFARVADQYHGKEQVLEAATEVRSLEPEVSANYSRSSWLHSAQEQPSVPRKTTSKPVLLPSATFPSTGRHAPGALNPSPFIAATSAIAPHARAPGSKLCKGEMKQAEEKARRGDEFTYDIWGNHFSGLHLMGRAKEVSTMISNASEGNSQSFFVRGPQILMQKSQARSVSPGPRLPYSAVSCLHQKG